MLYGVEAVFDDRTDAGKQLGDALSAYKGQSPVVLAIPKGGIPVGYAVARNLEGELAPLVSRKLPLPGNPEAGFGAVAEDGSLFIFEDMRNALGAGTIDRIIEQQREEIARRIALLRRNQPLPNLEDRTAILVDDGIAMGSTMRAGTACCRNRGVGTLVVAAPVSSPRTKQEMAELADDAVVLYTPTGFRAVAEAYREWHDVPDEEAVAVLEQWRREHPKPAGPASRPERR